MNKNEALEKFQKSIPENSTVQFYPETYTFESINGKTFKTVYLPILMRYEDYQSQIARFYLNPNKQKEVFNGKGITDEDYLDRVRKMYSGDR